MRMNFDTFNELYHYLVTSGCAFSLLSKKSILPSTGREETILGWRKAGYVPSTEDYAIYVRKVESLLRRRLSAALRMGGIYWRLARYYSQELSLEKLMSLKDEETEPLTKDEQDILIGRYYIATGREDQVSSSSWWPAHNATEGSFIDVGFWNPSCEGWFRNQLKAIAENKQRLKTSYRWRRVLRSVKQSGRFVKRHRDLSSAYIEADFSNTRNAGDAGVQAGR